ncbi:MAG TPA: TolC family protein [Pirellulaceae bacterium]|nr:TolC family protein [Pirellulaceae bacterium]
MRRTASPLHLLLVGLMIGLTGCHPTQPFYLKEDGDLSHYIDAATTADTPDVHQAPLPEVEHAHSPLTLSHPDFKEFWELSLEECVAITLANSKILRGGNSARLQNGQLFPGVQQGSRITNPGGLFSTMYDPAVVESNPGQANGAVPGFLQSGAGSAFNGPSVDGGVANVRQGVEAALAEFDAQLNITGTGPSGSIASSTDRPQNVDINAFGFPTILDLRNGGLQATLAKRTAEGSLVSFSSTTDYNRGISRGDIQALNSTWTQVLQVDVRHPLMQGRGAQINRMPVILARMGTDITIMNLMGALQDTLNNVEIYYWDLYLAYRNLETAKVGRDSALGTWRIVYEKFKQEVEPVQAEAQAREQYFSFRAAVETSLRNLYDTENNLRLLMGLAATDGRLIRPKDEPSLARVEFEWCDILAEAIARRPELIQQRWRIKTREMELILARNLLLPRLDVGAQYRWLGIGDDLIFAGRTGVDFPLAGSTAFEEITSGRFQEFSFLFQYDMPIGFRRELAGVRHAQLRLAREKAFLEDIELDVSHGLALSVRNVDTNFHLAQTNANRWAASQEDVNAREALYKAGRVALDDVLEAQRRRAVAQSAFWQSVIEYNKSIADLHTRKGSIMEYDGVSFGEGPWPEKAYWDALARARERDAGHYIDYGWTRPKVISRGPIPEHAPGIGSFHLENPDGAALEQLPAAEPTPAAPPDGGSGILPAPTPRTVPGALEARAPQPLSATPQLAVPDEPTPAALPAPPGGSVRKAAANLAPASFSSTNPLRINPAQPIGTGVADPPARAALPAGN